MIAKGFSLDDYPDVRRLVDAQASQIDFETHLHGNPQEPFGYHFKKITPNWQFSFACRQKNGVCVGLKGQLSMSLRILWVALPVLMSVESEHSC